MPEFLLKEAEEGELVMSEFSELCVRKYEQIEEEHFEQLFLNYCRTKITWEQSLPYLQSKWGQNQW